MIYLYNVNTYIICKVNNTRERLSSYRLILSEMNNATFNYNL